MKINYIPFSFSKGKKNIITSIDRSRGHFRKSDTPFYNKAFSKLRLEAIFRSR